MNRGNINQLSVKMMSVGDVEVGKSCLIKRYCEGNFISDYITTIGIDYGVKKVPINDMILAVNIFDLSGDDDYKSIRRQYYNDAIGVLMAYDVNIRTTFDNLVRWEKEADACGLDLSKCVVIVIGNKTDLKKKEVKTEYARDWARSRGYQFYECSARSGSNVSEAFKYLFDNMFLRSIDIRSKFIY